MKLLLYEWNTIGQQDLEDSLIRMGHEVDKIKYIFEDFENDEGFEKKLAELFLLKRYDFVISFNYFQVVSKVCYSFHLKYIAWVWDSPLINLYSKSVYNPCNYIFIFDKELYYDLKRLQVNTIYYLPLAVNVERLDNLVVSEIEQQQYIAEVTFVGNLYDSNHFDEITNLPDYLKGYFDGIMKAQMKIQGYNFIKEMLTSEIMEELLKHISIRMGDNFIGEITSVVADRFLNVKVTSMERRALLTLLSNHFDVTLYTGSDTSDITQIHNKGFIDYYNEMPKAFRCSKINLNITLRTIKSGIPLRIFDILGAGGFLITNYQNELSDYFEIDKDLVCYESEEDLLKKVQYYLLHEEERKQIANNGYQKVKKYHNYQTRLDKIFDITMGNTKEKMPLYPNERAAQLKEELKGLLKKGLIEQAKDRYYVASRQEITVEADQELIDLKSIFDIYNYESKTAEHTLFGISTELEKVLQHYIHIKLLIKRLEVQEEGAFQEFLRYVDEKQVSYTAISFIINEHAADKVKLLNDIAIEFYKVRRDNMVIPYLSTAYEIDSKNDTTLYNLGYILCEFGEYDMALEYLMNIHERNKETTELYEKINRYIL